MLWGFSVLNREVKFELALFLLGFFFSKLIVDLSKSFGIDYYSEHRKPL